MGLIEPGYLTGLYHPDRYFMADYHPEYSTDKFIRGVASLSNPLSAVGTITSRGTLPSNSRLGSATGISQLGSVPGITDTLNSEVSLQ